MDVLNSIRSPAENRTTRDKILASACDLFAHRGFQETTVQDICRQAGTNIASVNYHFRSKGELYLAVWVQADKLTSAVDGRINDELSPEEWLRRFIRQRIKVMFADGPEGWLPRLVYHEMHNPSVHHERIRRKVLEPVWARVERQVAAYLQKEVASFETEMAAHALMGFLPTIAHLRHRRRAKLGADEIERLMHQTQAYILGGLNGVKREIHKEST